MSLLLRIKDLSVRIDGKDVLRGLSADFPLGSITAIFGHNGAGKTTLLRSIMGLWELNRGTIEYDNVVLSGKSTQFIVNCGVAIVPQLNGTFQSLTVEENLRFFSRADSHIKTDDVYTLFPILRDRRRQRVGSMSGGQRQMVAVANALLLGPTLLLLDEPSGGLAPHVVGEMFHAITEISQSFGVTCLLVEQNVRGAAALAQQVLVLNQGQISYFGDSDTALREKVWELV